MCLSTKKSTLYSIVSEFSVFILSKRSNAESIDFSGIQADWNMFGICNIIIMVEI